MTKKLFAFLLMALLLLCMSCLPAATLEKADKPSALPHLTSVEIEDKYIRFLVDGGEYSYSLPEPENPFTTILELQGVEPGSFTVPIQTQKGNIKEVLFSKKTSPWISTMVEITHTVPVRASAFYESGVLTLFLTGEGEQAGRKGQESSGPAAGSNPATAAGPSEKGEVDRGANKPQATASRILGIELTKEQAAAKLKITGDGVLNPSVLKDNNLLIIEIPGVKIPAASAMPDRTVSPVRKFAWEIRNNNVRLTLDLEKDTLYLESRLNDVFLVTFASEDVLKEPMKAGVQVSISGFAPISGKEAAAATGQNAKAESGRTGESKKPAESAGAGEKKSPSIEPPVLPQSLWTQEGPVAPSSLQEGSGAQSTPGKMPSLAYPVDEYLARCDDDGYITGGRCEKTRVSEYLNFDFKNADIVPLIGLLSDASGCNLVVNPQDTAIQGKKVTMKVKNSKWNNIANLLLKSYSLACRQEGNILMITSRTQLQKESDDRLKRRQDKIKEKELDVQLQHLSQKEKDGRVYMEIPIVEIFTLSYTLADDVKNILLGLSTIPSVVKKEGKEPPFMQGALGELTKARMAGDSSRGAGQDQSTGSSPAGDSAAAGRTDSASGPQTNRSLLSPLGTVISDAKSNTLIIKDIPSALPSIAKLIFEIDQPATQILIEARIVEIQKDSTLNLGINWGLFSKSLDGTAGGGGTFGGLSGGSYLPNIPTSLTTLGSGMLMGIISKDRTTGLDLSLSALATDNKARVITKPSILTLDHHEATISQGSQAPYQVINQYGIGSVAYLNLATTIDVTPNVTRDNSILLNLNISKQDQTGTVPVAGSDAPTSVSLNETTKAIVGDGETLVLGGLFSDSKNVTVSGLPGLKDIPVLGWLFKEKTEENTTNEFLIFITPRILKPRAAQPLKPQAQPGSERPLTR